jgi:hypothetical protein
MLQVASVRKPPFLDARRGAVPESVLSAYLPRPARAQTLDSIHTQGPKRLRAQRAWTRNRSSVYRSESASNSRDQWSDSADIEWAVSSGSGVVCPPAGA